MTDNKEVAITVPFEWALKKVLGPVSEIIGQDIRTLYEVGRDKIVSAAYRKIENPEDQKIANIRVARDVLWHGAFSDDEICAEYFGGILASSRSQDGQDDSGIEFADTIKSLSASQLKTHYIIYRGLRSVLSRANDKINVAQGSEVQKKTVFFDGNELIRLGINVDTDLNVLYRRGLLSRYKMDNTIIDGVPFYYVSANPTVYGILLYVAAHNQLERWREFTDIEFGEFKDIVVPKDVTSTLKELAQLLRTRTIQA